MSKAKTDVLEALHTEIAKQLLERIKSGEATASDLNVARQFLKDNNIDGADEEGTPQRELANELPDPDSATVVVPLKR